MIKRLYTLSTQCQNPYENIAREEALLYAAPPDSVILYLWQNRRTVVIGRNQCAQKECDIAALEKDGGYLARRLSGGGAVYHDLGNLNYTFLARDGEYDLQKQTSVIARAVRSFGVPVCVSGRNDLTADGRKFSGSAYYQSGDKRYHHGTLMLDVDTEALQKYLRVAPEKLRAKGVDSVRSRVVNLCALAPQMTVAALKEALVRAFEEEYGRGAQELWDLSPSPERVAFFSSWDFCVGKNTVCEWTGGRRFDWGMFSLGWTVKDGRLETCTVASDAMDEETVRLIPEHIAHCPLRYGALEAALEPLKKQNAQLIGDVCAFIKEEGF